MNSRRKFLKKSALLSSLSGLFSVPAGAFSHKGRIGTTTAPLIISTWNHGLPANEAAWGKLKEGGSALDAAEAGVKVPEGDPNVMSVGFGGLPDADGRVTLDACIMDGHNQCGSVACIEHIKHPVSVARKVMEDTQHVMLVGEGALEFALKKGFKKENLLTPKSLKAWEGYKKELEKKRSIINIENHDTIGLLVLDGNGNISGACTTSGMANKIHGRVGDSPIIGAGLFVDGEVGGACATGVGEEVIRQAGSAMIVELMRSGMVPEMACREVLNRIVKTNGGKIDFQVGFLALRKDGHYGAYSLKKGFNFAVCDSKGNNLRNSPFMFD